MSKTRRGIYHNLKQTEYAISNKDIAFFFSSDFYLNKFLNEYKEHRKRFDVRLKRIVETGLSFDYIADMLLYSEIEKRGFRCVVNNVEFNEVVNVWLNLLKFVSVRTIEKTSLDYEKIHLQK